MKNSVKAMIRCLMLPLLLAGSTILHAQSPSLPADKVLARNQRVAVTYADFEAELARVTPDDRFEILLDRSKVAMVVDNILINKTLALEARENKLDALPEAKAEIANQTEKVLAKYRGRQYQNALPKIDHVPRAREIYLTTPERFTTQELHDVWHVLIDLKTRTSEQANARAQEVRQKLLAGESPEKLALEYSDDTSKKTNKGNIGPYNLKDLDPRFAKTVAGMKVQDVAITESVYGVHVVKLLNHIPSVRQPFEAAKAALVQDAETEYLRATWNNYLRTIRSDPKLFVDVEALDSLRPKVPDVTSIPKAAATTATPPPAKSK